MELEAIAVLHRDGKPAISCALIPNKMSLQTKQEGSAEELSEPGLLRTKPPDRVVEMSEPEVTSDKTRGNSRGNV